MRLWHILQSRLRSLFLRDRREADLREELQFHLERETQKHLANGVGAADARRRATAGFGSVTVVADECRDARGTALFDSLVRDVLYAGRSFRRTPLVALTVVTTVGLGLGLVAAVFTILNAVIFRPDAVRNPHELFAVERQRSANAEPEPFTRAQYDALLRETGVFTDAFAMGPDIDWWIDGVRMEGTPVTGNFFQLLGVSAARGRTLTPSDDVSGGPRLMVLSHRAWSRHFANDSAVLSRMVQVSGVTFQIAGVMPESFRGLTVAPPDFWVPLSLPGQFRRNNEGRDGALAIVGRLKPGVSRDQGLAELQVWDSRLARGLDERRSADGSGGRPAAGLGLVLEPRQGTVPLSVEALLLFMPIFFAFGLVLMIGWANVANLLLARAVARQREIGIRLAIGASRRRVIRQLLTESLLLALGAAVLAFGVSRLVLETIVYVMTRTWASAFGDIRLTVPPADWNVGFFLLAGAIISTLFFALAPALQATRIELVRAIRGEVVRDARPGRARTALVALQVTGSALLLICAGVFLRSALAAASVDPGIRTADTVTVGVVNEDMRGPILEALRSEPSVAAVSASWPGDLGGRPAFADGLTGKSPVEYQFVSPEYFSVLGIDLVSGRGFAPTERTTDAAVVIVSARVASQLWPDRDALGQVLHLEPDLNRQTPDPDAPQLPRTAVVVGIARDVAGFRLAGATLGGAGVYVPIDVQAPKTTLTMRVRGDLEQARRSLIDRMTAIDPNMAEVTTLQTIASLEAYLLGIPFWLTLVLGTLALLLTISGLFSVLSYLVEQRTREIGVRMALGATGGSIAALVLSQLARPVGIGLMLGGALTAALGAALLATPAAALIGSTVRLFDPLAYAAGLLSIVAACACAALVPVLRATRIHPIDALRQE